MPKEPYSPPTVTQLGRFPRYPGEDDDTYANRIQKLISNRPRFLPGMQQAIDREGKIVNRRNGESDSAFFRRAGFLDGLG